MKDDRISIGTDILQKTSISGLSHVDKCTEKLFAEKYRKFLAL